VMVVIGVISISCRCQVVVKVGVRREPALAGQITGAQCRPAVGARIGSIVRVASRGRLASPSGVAAPGQDRDLVGPVSAGSAGLWVG
jgi:hypothetical protein